MEAFSLLKYWRAGGGGSGGATTTTVPEPITNAKATTKTIVTAAAVSPNSSDGEDGPYFDLEFALPDQESDTDEQTSAKSQENDMKRLQTEDEDETESQEMSVLENDDDDEEEEEEAELKFSLTSNESTDQNAAHSPSDELFFKGDLVSIEPSSVLLNSAEENAKFPVFLVKSATKFRVLLLKLKKSKSVTGENLSPEAVEKSGKDETSGQVSPTPVKIVERENEGKVSGKLFVKFKVEEVPLVNLFTRDNSSKENHGKAPKQNVQDSDERKLSKEVMNKYLKRVKPFYIRVSKRYVEKLKFSGHSAGASKGCAASPPAAPSNVKSSQHKQGNNLQAGLKVVRKHLSKSRSASASASAAAAAAPPAKVASDRRDDSLLQLQDGIQGAILHCKKSFNASRDAESILCRSVSDPSYEKSIMMPKFSRASSSTSGEAKKGCN